MRDVFLVGQVTSAEDGWESVIHCSPLLPPGKSSSLLRDEKQPTSSGQNGEFVMMGTVGR